MQRQVVRDPQPFEILERRWGSFNGFPPERSVVCSSGTAALHLALEALELPSGSLVAVPDYTMISCARAVTLAGLSPVFVGQDDRLLMDVDALEEAFEKHPIRAVIAVHVYGRRCNMEGIHDLILGRGSRVDVIEDLAEAHGLYPHPRTDAACWSFYRNKIVHGEEGGAVCFRSVDQASLARQLRSVGFTNAHDYRHVPRGHNYRLANILALPILESIDDFAKNWAARRRIEEWYDSETPSNWRMPHRAAPWVYDLRIPGMKDEQRDSVVSELKRNGIQARHGFFPLSLQPEYRGCPFVGSEERKGKFAEHLYLPLSPGISREEAGRTLSILREAIGRG